MFYTFKFQITLGFLFLKSRAPKDDEVRMDWILERFDMEGDDWLVNSM